MMGKATELATISSGFNMQDVLGYNLRGEKNMQEGLDGEVSGYDDSGIVGDSRHGLQPEASRNSQGIPKQDDESSRPEIEGGGIGKREGSIDQAVIDSEEVTEREIERAFSAVQMSSGPIPDADMYLKYPLEVQKKIIEWQDRQIKAMFDDESIRQNKLVDGEIKPGNVGQWLSFAINSFIVVGALIAFVMTGNANVFWSYTILGASVVGNVVVHINDKNHKADGD